MNVIDSSAWLEYFADGPNASFFAEPIEDTPSLVVPTLTCLSHELSAAAPDPSASAAFRLVGLLDVLSSTPPGSSRRAPCPDGVSDSSRRKPVRKAG